MWRSSVLALSLLAAAGCAKPAPNGSSSTGDPAPQSHKRLANPMTLQAIQSRLAADKASGKVAVAHYWATWCGPCVEEFPHLAELYKSTLSQDPKIDFFAVAVDVENPDEVDDFILHTGASFPVFIADTDDPQAFIAGVKSDWPGVLPTTFVYGPDGRMQIERMGEIEDLKLFSRQLKSLESGT